MTFLRRSWLGDIQAPTLGWRQNAPHPGDYKSYDSCDSVVSRTSVIHNTSSINRVSVKSRHTIEQRWIGHYFLIGFPSRPLIMTSQPYLPLTCMNGHRFKWLIRFQYTVM